MEFFPKQQRAALCSNFSNVNRTKPFGCPAAGLGTTREALIATNDLKRHFRVFSQETSLRTAFSGGFNAVDTPLVSLA